MSGSPSMKPSYPQCATTSTQTRRRCGSKRQLYAFSHATNATYDKTFDSIGLWNAANTERNARNPHKCKRPKTSCNRMKRFARMDVAAYANIQPPVTSQTQLMHLYGRQSFESINKRPHPKHNKPRMQPKAKSIHRIAPHDAKTTQAQTS